MVRNRAQGQWKTDLHGGRQSGEKEGERMEKVYSRMKGQQNELRESEMDPHGNMFRKGKEGMRERWRESVRKHVTRQEKEERQQGGLVGRKSGRKERKWRKDSGPLKEGRQEGRQGAKEGRWTR